MKSIFIILIVNMLLITSIQANIVDKILYIGAQQEATPISDLIDGFENNQISFDDHHKLILRGYEFNRPISQLSYVILFLGGNGFHYYYGDPLQQKLNVLGGDKKFALYTLQYPGYSGSELPMNEETFTKAGILALRKLRQTFPAKKIIIWGHSLGAGVAAQVASREEVGGNYNQVILSAAWSKFYDVCAKKAGWAQFLCPKGQYETITILSKITVPLFLIHGDMDEVIPVQHFQNNLSVLKNERHLLNLSDISYLIPGKGHNNLINDDGTIDWIVQKITEAP